jgi:hypothetical protein
MRAGQEHGQGMPVQGLAHDLYMAPHIESGVLGSNGQNRNIFEKSENVCITYNILKIKDRILVYE